MIIICEECATAYNMDDSLIDADGSKVRCTKCRHEFVVYPHDGAEGTGADPETATDPAPGGDENLALLDARPLPVDFDDGHDSLDDERKTAICGDGIGIEMDPESGDGELTLEKEDGLEDFAENDLPAIEDLEDFDEALLAECNEPPAGEMPDPEAELLLEEEATGSVDDAVEDPQQDTLDLSDIEDLVNSGDFPGADEPSEPEAEEEPLLLEPEEEDGRERMDIGGDDEPWEALDISEIEKMLAEDDGPAPEVPLLEEDEEPVLELDDFPEAFAGEAKPDPLEDILLETDDPQSEPEIEIQFETEAESIESGGAEEQAPAGEIEPEILLEEQTPAEEAVSEILFEEPAPVDFEGETFLPDDAGSAVGPSDSGVTAVLDGGATQVLDSTLEISPAETPANTRKSRKPLLAAAAALIVIAAIVLAVSLAGIRVSDVAGFIKSVPFAGDFFGPEEKDPAGNMRILPLEETVSGKFVNNTKSGRLFVIEGRVRNAYDHPRSHIKIVGRLYQKGKRLSKTTRVYCGNILSDAELKAMDMGNINRRLVNHRGDTQSNLHLKPGRSIPFMIVFSQLPDSLDEYAIQVDSSSG